MKEFQAVIVRQTRISREDEEALTDLAERAEPRRVDPDLMTQDGVRLTIVFSRDATLEG